MEWSGVECYSAKSPHFLVSIRIGITVGWLAFVFASLVFRTFLAVHADKLLRRSGQKDRIILLDEVHYWKRKYRKSTPTAQHSPPPLSISPSKVFWKIWIFKNSFREEFFFLNWDHWRPRQTVRCWAVGVVLLEKILGRTNTSFKIRVGIDKSYLCGCTLRSTHLTQ